MKSVLRRDHVNKTSSKFKVGLVHFFIHPFKGPERMSSICSTDLTEQDVLRALPIVVGRS